MQINVGWSDLKSFASDRNLSIQYVVANGKYHLAAIDGNMELSAQIPMDSGADQVDFETNFKDAGNKSPAAQVITQFEKRDKTLKLAHGSASVGGDGIATVLMKIPGTPGSGDGRWILSGTAFFDSHTAGDKIIGVFFTDEDNLLGTGAGSIIGSYTDLDADSVNQGWLIPPIGSAVAEAVGGYGFAPSGFYIKVVGKKGGGLTSGTFACNFSWGKIES